MTLGFCSRCFTPAGRQTRPIPRCPLTSQNSKCSGIGSPLALAADCERITGEPEVIDHEHKLLNRILVRQVLSHTRCRPPCGFAIEAERSGRINLYSPSGTSSVTITIPPSGEAGH